MFSINLELIGILVFWKLLKTQVFVVIQINLMVHEVKYGLKCRYKTIAFDFCFKQL